MKSWMSTRRPAWAPPPKIWISGSGSSTVALAGEIAPQRHAPAAAAAREHRQRDRGQWHCRRAATWFGVPSSAISARVDPGLVVRHRGRPSAGAISLSHARQARFGRRSPPSLAPPSRRSSASPAAARGAGRRDGAPDGAVAQGDFRLDRRPAARIPDAPAAQGLDDGFAQRLRAPGVRRHRARRRGGAAMSGTAQSRARGSLGLARSNTRPAICRRYGRETRPAEARRRALRGPRRPPKRRPRDRLRQGLERRRDRARAGRRCARPSAGGG